MKAYLGRRYHFSASHRLHAASLSEQRNRDVYGKCNNAFGHGHNYTVEVIFSGAVDAVTGMVVNLADLDEFAHRRVLNQFDHANLNLSGSFKDLVPTTENLAVELHKLFALFPLAQLERVRVEETANNSFQFLG